MSIKNQFKTIHPSIPDALYRRLLREDTLAFLREDEGIIGFEIDFQQSPELSGFTLIGIKKHTVLAYRNEHRYQLVLFPTVAQLQDKALDLGPLVVQKKRYMDNSFEGEVLATGTIGNLMRDLTPPYKGIDLSDQALDSLDKAMNRGLAVLDQMEQESKHVFEESPTLEEIATPVAMMDEGIVDEESFDEAMFEDPMIDEPAFDDGFETPDDYLSLIHISEPTRRPG